MPVDFSRVRGSYQTGSVKSNWMLLIYQVTSLEDFILMTDDSRQFRSDPRTGSVKLPLCRYVILYTEVGWK